MDLKTTLCVAAAMAMAGGASAGDLTPAGPPAPTMKTLDEVEPRTPIANDPSFAAPVVISSPGSYYLVEDILGLPGQDGITIDASDVTLDLNGFSVIGNLEVLSEDGVDVPDAGHRNITIRNGTVKNFAGGHGLKLAFAENCRIEHVTASLNGNGVSGGDGFNLGGGTVVVGCIAVGNGDDGYSAAFPVAFEGCSATGNTDDGFSVVDATIRGSTARSNGADGFDLLRSTVSDSQATDNACRGFRLNQTSAEACAAYSNDMHGFAIEAGVAQNCVASFNTDAGFFHMIGGKAIGCTANANGGSGFEVVVGEALHCTARSNAVGFEGAAGEGRIEGCHAIENNGPGFKSTGNGNVYLRNRARGAGTQFDLLGPGFNSWGPIVNIAGAGDIGAVVGADHPMANYKY